VQLAAELDEALAPADEFERCLVDTMVLSIWRRTRILGMESAGLQAVSLRHRPQTRPGEGHDIYPLAFASLVAHPAERQVLDLLHRYEARHARAFERAFRSLAAYRAFRKTDPAPAPPSETENVPNEPGPAKQEQETAAQAAAATAEAPQQDEKKRPNEPKPGTPEAPSAHCARHKKLNRKQRRQLKFGSVRAPLPISADGTGLARSTFNAPDRAGRQ